MERPGWRENLRRKQPPGLYQREGPGLCPLAQDSTLQVVWVVFRVNHLQITLSRLKMPFQKPCIAAFSEEDPPGLPTNLHLRHPTLGPPKIFIGGTALQWLAVCPYVPICLSCKKLVSLPILVPMPLSMYLFMCGFVLSMYPCCRPAYQWNLCLQRIFVWRIWLCSWEMMARILMLSSTWERRPINSTLVRD